MSAPTEAIARLKRGRNSLRYDFEHCCDIDAALARIETLEGALKECGLRFCEYVGNHMDKEPPDIAKAARNREMVELITRALNGTRP